MSRPDLGALIAQTMAPPAQGRTIEAITNEILDLKQTAGEAILEIGNRLIEAQTILSHGDWLVWLAEQVECDSAVAFGRHQGPGALGFAGKRAGRIFGRA